MKIERCEKESFVVIGKEGSTLDGAGFIQRLWDDANSHFEEVQHLAKKDENGNLRYEYFYPMEDEETVLLIDSWNDQQAIDVHHASPMMAKIMELREKYDLHMKVERYVSDEAGVPVADQAFIKD